MPPHPSYDEQELMLRISRGDQNAFGDFFHSCVSGVYVVIRKLVKDDEVAKDILQEVFIKAWNKRHDLPKIEKPSSWLLRTGSNMALNYLRNEKNRASIRESIRYTFPLFNETAHSQVYAKETILVIREAISLLPAQRRKIFELSREQGLDRGEIAITLGISENTVKNQLVIALKFIRDHLASKGIDTLSLVMAGNLIFFLNYNGTVTLFTCLIT